MALTLVFLPKYSNGFPSEPTFEDSSIKPSENGSVTIDDMILDKFQFNNVKGADISDEPGDGVAFSAISEDIYRWPTQSEELQAELPYK